jgi:hypothetical protein
MKLFQVILLVGIFITLVNISHDLYNISKTLTISAAMEKPK